MMNNTTIELELKTLDQVSGGSDEEWAALEQAIKRNPDLSREWDRIKSDPSFGSNADRVLEILNRHWGLDSSYGEGNIPIRFWQEGNWYKSYSFGSVLDRVNNYTAIKIMGYTIN